MSTLLQRCISTVVATAVLLSCGRASAQERVVESEKWYGAPIIVTDALAVAAAAGGAALFSESDNARKLVPALAGAGLFVLGALTFAAGGPIVHGAEGQGPTAVGSLGMRIGAIGLTYAAATELPERKVSAAAKFAIGSVLVALVSVIDIAFLARKTERSPAQP